MKKIIKIMKRIVENRQYEMYNDVAIDMQTANAVMTVFNALNKKNKKKFSKLSLSQLVNVSWKIISKSNKKAV